MKIWYDTEFIEDGRTIDLISIGMVAEDGRELYLIVGDGHAVCRAVENDWLREHVVPSLPALLTSEMPARFWKWNPSHLDYLAVNRRDTIAASVREFIQATPDPELWAWYAAYDHVALCQLWGTMMDLPKGVPMWTNDLKQECVRLGDPRVPEQESGEHNALEDARHCRVIAEFLARWAEEGSQLGGTLRRGCAGVRRESRRAAGAHLTGSLSPHQK